MFILETLLQQRIALKGILKAPQKQETVDLFKHEQEQLMITKYIKIVSQNVWKNNLIVNIILKTQFSFNVIFIQESSWTTIHSILSFRSVEGKELVRVLNYSNWLIFARNLSSDNSSPRVITYINIRLLSFQFHFIETFLTTGIFLSYLFLTIVSFYSL